jgi:hypothetical protein
MLQMIRVEDIRTDATGTGIVGQRGVLYQTSNETPSRLLWWDGERMVQLSTYAESQIQRAPRPAQIAADALPLADRRTQWPASLRRAITLPNPYTGLSNAPVHPSLVSFTTPWNGYSFWVAYTPYPGSDSQYENPCVAASNDLITWVSPATNPLVAHPGGTVYNADTHLFMSSDGLTMYLAFRERGTAATNRLKIMHTTNGRTWSAPVTVLTGDVGTLDFGSPSIWWNGTGWTMVSHNLDDSSPWPLQRRVSSTSDIYGAWGSPTTVTMTPPAGRAWWHSCMVRVASNHVIGLAQDNSGSPGASGNLYYVESGDDGASFVVLGAVSTAGGKYRSALAARSGNPEPILDLLIGELSGTITHAEAYPGAIAAREAFSDYVSSCLVAGAALPPFVVFTDTATRADSASTPNPASCGLSYTVSSGTWGISTNRLYPVANGRLLYATGSTNHKITVRMLDMTTSVQQWVICRAVDGSNYYRVGVVSPTSSGAQTLAIQDIVSGSVQSTTTIGNITRGDYLTVQAAGAMILVSVNGQLVAETVAARFPSGASVGIQANTGANTFFDDVVISLI